MTRTLSNYSKFRYEVVEYLNFWLWPNLRIDSVDYRQLAALIEAKGSPLAKVIESAAGCRAR